MLSTIGRQASRIHSGGRSLIKALGPGLITGAADDDPSGIATYSQAGAQFGYGMLWSILFTLPLMIGIQIVSARIGRVTGHGLAANIREHYPAWLLRGVVGLLLVANTINIAVDLGAMAAALRLLIGGSSQLVHRRLRPGIAGTADLYPVPALRADSEVADADAVRLRRHRVRGARALARGAAAHPVPPVVLSADYLLTLVAVFGTTISPYLFFWQASQEVEEQRAGRAKTLARGAGASPART